MVDTNISELLQTAIDRKKLEYEFFKKAETNNRNIESREFFKQLATQEDKFINKLYLLYQHMLKYKHWLAVQGLFDDKNGMNEVHPGLDIDPILVDGETAVRKAIEMEEKVVSVYSRLHEEAKDKNTKEVLERLIIYEKEHLDILYERSGQVERI